MRHVADRAKENVVKWGVFVLTFLLLVKMIWLELQSFLH